MFADVSEVLAAAIIRTMSYSSPVNFYQTTRRNNTEDSHLHTRRRENLKPQQHTNERHVWILIFPVTNLPTSSVEYLGVPSHNVFTFFRWFLKQK
jgi:hypothetical protein